MLPINGTGFLVAFHHMNLNNAHQGTMARVEDNAQRLYRNSCKYRRHSLNASAREADLSKNEDVARTLVKPYEAGIKGRESRILF